MDFYAIKTIRGYLDILKQEAKWRLKSIENDDSSYFPDSDSKTNKIQTLRAKLRVGKKLSPSEMSFLSKHAPELYNKAVRVELDRQAYKQALKNCKTRDEAKSLHRLRTIMSAGEVSRGDSEEAEMRMNASSRTMREFMSSTNYAALKNEKKYAAAKKRNGQASIFDKKV